MPFGSIYCGHTGEICNKLVELRSTNADFRNELGSILGAIASGCISAPQRDRLYASLDEGMRKLELLEVADEGPCIVLCALSGVNVPEYVTS